ncbi:MAG: group III truncated hemoglobin [Cyclobacteriaceae bacterium]|nr:group III truncated hemoglobin [Cytophagales bacterium]MBX2898616.1 group III truncated hemoglobin [Cyclobacteriaceae bacterium]
MQALNSRSEIELLVNTFYDKVKQDPLLAPLFAHVDWPHHLPVMYNFWASMLLGDRSYTGNPFQKHMPLPLTPMHFSRWLELFNQTVDENFTGAKAEEVKARAQSIATVFQFKLNLTP